MTHGKRKRWTAIEIQHLKQLYPTTPNDILCAQFKVSLKKLYNAAKQYNIKKTPEYLKTNGGQIKKGEYIGSNTTFKPGNVPFNKGKKMKEYITPELAEKIKQTCFKPGHLPKNTKYDGAITIRHYKGKPYKYIRVGLAQWMPLHQYLYQCHIGHIPKGHVVIMKDGDSMNTELSNLLLISRKDLVILNGHARGHACLLKSINLKSQLTKKLKHHER